jgi:hypothetical protein
MDSHGHCAQYCSYTFMVNMSKKIVCIITMYKRATEKKSTLLEKACFLKGLQFLREKRIHVVEVITDGSILNKHKRISHVTLGKTQQNEKFIAVLQITVTVRS